MLKSLSAAACAVACVSASPVPPEPVRLATASDDLPPERFRNNGAAVVVFTDRAGIDEACGVAKPPNQIIACTRRTADGTPVIFMPNACLIGQTEYYAKIMCHEMGHVQGWGANHEP